MGLKDRNLTLLNEAGLPGVNIPQFIVLNSYFDFSKNFLWFNKNQKYAVRSSGNISCPGRMKTLLNVTFDDLDDAIIKVFTSGTSTKVQKFLEAKSFPIKDFKLDVIVQNMVPMGHNLYSGVLSTINPYGYNEIYVELIKGEYGDSLMAGRTTPINLKDDPEYLPNEYRTNLIITADRIKSFFKQDVEIEFAISNHILYILQVRLYSKEVYVPLYNHIFSDTKPLLVGKPVMGVPTNSGVVTFDINNNKRDSIYCCKYTEYDDTTLLLKHTGLITEIGGTMSHCAIIAKQFDVPSIVGASGLFNKLKEGDQIIYNKTGGIWKI